MDLQLQNKVVLITGGSKGIGLACAAAFKAEGATVAIASRSGENLAQACERLQIPAAQGFKADLTRPAEAAALVEAVESQIGPIEILVNSAGAARRAAIADLNPAAWQAAIDAKFFTYIHAMDSVLKRMAERGRGAVVNIIGMGGKVANPLHVAGGAANAGLMLATAGLAAAYGPKGIRINGINPGFTLTDRLEHGLSVEARDRSMAMADLLAERTARIPLRRFGTPEEVANVALFLASDRASYLTGALIPMDGGASPVI